MTVECRNIFDNKSPPILLVCFTVADWLIKGGKHQYFSKNIEFGGRNLKIWWLNWFKTLLERINLNLKDNIRVQDIHSLKVSVFVTLFFDLRTYMCIDLYLSVLPVYMYEKLYGRSCCWNSNLFNLSSQPCHHFGVASYKSAWSMWKIKIYTVYAAWCTSLASGQHNGCFCNATSNR